MGIRSRLDSWKNALTGLGGARDKRTHTHFRKCTVLDDQTLEDLYHNEDLAALICDILPEDATRRGFKLTIKDNPELATKVQMRADELELVKSVCDAAIWGRCFGAGAIFVGVDDGSPVNQPLKPEKTKGIKFLTVLDKRDLTAAQWYADPLQPKYGQPSHYRFTNYLSSREVNSVQVRPNVVVHESRLIMFQGARTTKRERIRNQGWNYSVLQKVYDILRDFNMGWASAGYLLQESSQGVYKVKGLLDIISSENGEEELEERMRLIDMARSVARSIIVDSEEEDYTRQTVSFTNVPEMLDRFCNRLAAATRIPVTRLMGQSPAGLNATGDSDAQNWNRVVRSYQEMELTPALEKIVQLLLLEQGAEPEDWKVDFPPLSEMTEKETAELRKLVMETDKGYVDMQAITPEEVATNRFTAEGWSMETTIDLELREELKEMEAENMLTRKEEPADLQSQNIEKEKHESEIAAGNQGTAAEKEKPAE